MDAAIGQAREKLGEFSFRTRAQSLKRFRSENFDVLVIGGGITGAAVARDAASRGLSVALVERRDFAFGTSSRSSKLIHGGLRYLENFEFGLVFEALSERALLLRTVPHLVRPLQFYLPVYEGDPNSRFVLGVGLWLYDLLALFRTPGFHRSLSRQGILDAIPFMKKEGLRGGFTYYDASMWDDVLAVETLRGASHWGAAIASYTEAVEPLWFGKGTESARLTGFKVRDLLSGEDIDVRARTVVVCAGPWTDEMGGRLSPRWRTLLKPSKGVHLLFDLKRVPVPGAMVMSHPQDGRISFVIPRPDFGNGVVIVGTTDGPTPKEPERAEVDPGDVRYLLELLARYFPDLRLEASDILSAYVGVRPLMGASQEGSESQSNEHVAPAVALQKVSREHHIELGPGSSVIVAGGKYTTHRRMAEEIVDFTLKRAWHGPAPARLGRSRTKAPVNPMATWSAIAAARESAAKAGLEIPSSLFGRYGAEALDVWAIHTRSEGAASNAVAVPDRGGLASRDPDGFPALEAQLRYSIRNEMTLNLADFYLRRVPLFATRADHGMPWAPKLARVWREELGASAEAEREQLARLQAEVEALEGWKLRLKN